ncbi:MAG: hypothetical protein COA79_12710 [Planctomycetota bacterium]|nr:MAG: hypothetical protein COA79_12710 [Planctomycetota bacterium]
MKLILTKVLFSILLTCSTAVFLCAETFGPEAINEFKIKRAQIFEFTQKLKLTRKGDDVTISFAVKAACDVAVAIEDSQGKILRHLGAGILGEDPPEPFQKGLSQKIIWDGKDNFGKYVKDLATCTVRVSLGLKAAFEKNLHYNPLRSLGNDTSIACDKDGVYIYQSNMNDYVRHFDHEGNYVKTIYPFSASKLKSIKNLKMRAVPGGKPVPNKTRAKGEETSTVTLLSTKPLLYKKAYQVGAMVLRDGLLSLHGNQGISRLGTDGTTKGQPFHGPSSLMAIGKGKKKKQSCPPYEAAYSSDDKWIYGTQYFWMGGWAPYSKWPHYLTRQPSDGSKPPEIFIGKHDKGNSNEQLNNPTSVAVDRKGRIYISDWYNDRVQVFSADGVYFTSIKPITGPAKVMLDPKTDEIYVATWQVSTKDPYGGKANRAFNKRCKQTLLKYSALKSGKVCKIIKKWSFDIYNKKRGHANRLVHTFKLSGMQSRFVIDFHSKPLRAWVSQPGMLDKLYLLELQGDKMILKRNFNKEIEKEGYSKSIPYFQRRYLHYDPVREKLYVAEMNQKEVKHYNQVFSIDVKSGAVKLMRLPHTVADSGFDAKGRYYMRSGSTIIRYNPTTWKEIPYDYGESRKKVISLIPTIGGGASSDKYGGFGVSPLGDTVVACVWKGSDTSRGSKEKKRQDFKGRWTAKVYPGRPGGLYVHVYDTYGNLKQEDVVKGGGTFTGGLQMDMQGNVYAVIRKNRILDGKVYGNSGTGTLAKFKPGKGRLISTRSRTPLDTKPSRPQDVSGAWIEGAEYLYGESAIGSNSHCWCRHGQFFVDYYGRAFVCEQERYSIAVLDPKGRVIDRIGHFGNVDDPGITMFDAQFIQGHTDKRIFVADNGNGRVFSATLNYHKTARVSLKDVLNKGDAP